MFSFLKKISQKNRRKTKQESPGPIDAILALDFGALFSPFPLPDDPVCKSNQAIAALVCDFAQIHPDAKLIVQDEIGLEIKERLSCADPEKMLVIAHNKRKPWRRLDTRGFLEQAVEHISGFNCKAERRFYKILLVCHPAHLWRAKQALETLLFKADMTATEVIVPPKEDLRAIPYDRNSSQWWTRGVIRWWIREVLVIFYYKTHRWI